MKLPLPVRVEPVNTLFHSDSLKSPSEFLPEYQGWVRGGYLVLLAPLYVARAATPLVPDQPELAVSYSRLTPGLAKFVV